MTDSGKRYLLILFYAVLFIVVALFAPTKIDWRDSFTRHDKIPYGMRVMHERIADMFPDSKIYTADRTLYEEMSDSSELLYDNYLFINRYVDFDELDYSRIRRQAESGAQVFVSCNFGYGSEILVDLGIGMDYEWPGNFDVFTDSTSESELSEINPIDQNTVSCSVKLADTLSKEYKIRTNYNFQFFADLDSSEYEIDVLGFAQDSFPNFIKVSYGDGAFFSAY